MEKIRTAKFQDIVYNGKYGFQSRYPFLKLSGKWLEDAGFNIYETCQLSVSKNKIIITKITKDEASNKSSTSKANA